MTREDRLNLKSRFLILAAALIVPATWLAWGVFNLVAEEVIERWGQRVVEIQVRYDSARLLQPIEREIALARQMAQSQVLKQWAARVDDPELHRRALVEMENYRQSFQDRSYFVALLDSGAYYHNNATNEFADQPLRYHLRRDNPADAWFYGLIDQGREFHLNVNPDESLNVTKLWVDVQIRDGDRPLGIVGTGMALDSVLKGVVDIGQPGITSLFVDSNGAIQLYRDQSLIDFASVVKPEGKKSLVTQMLDLPADRERLKGHLATLSEPGAATAQVVSDFVQFEGRRHLMGVAYLPTIGWYEVTFMDLDELMPVSQFAPVVAVFGATLVAAMLLMHLMLRRWVLKPLSRLEEAMVRVRDGDLAPPELTGAAGEIGRLNQHFTAMANAIRNNTRDLEDKVKERTEALDRLARIDPLTQLVNRRGMGELLEAAAHRAQREGHPYGVIYLDVDWFKQINDTQGHAAGDQALTTVADVLRSQIRPYDHAARWGGDEFLVLLSPCDAVTLQTLGERIRATVEQQTRDSGMPLTLSLGACLSGGRSGTAEVLYRVDAALYAAKDRGRNLLVTGEETP